MQDRLAAHGRRPRADDLLVTLLRLEGTGHVAVERGPSMRFSLTPSGRERGRTSSGGGHPVHLQLLMADLVGFTAFTSAHGAMPPAMRPRARAAPGGVRRRCATVEARSSR